VLARVNGVGEVMMFGAKDYSMRIWLDPELLKARNLTTNEVLNALKEQNVQVAAGKIGEEPNSGNLNFEYTLTTLGRLAEVSQFEQIIVKRGEGTPSSMARRPFRWGSTSYRARTHSLWRRV